MKRTGILLDENYDLRIEVRRDATGKIAGGMAAGSTIFQNQHVLLLAEKGEIKEYPLVGVGIKTYVDDENPANLTRAIRTEFAGEGMRVKRIDFENGKIKIDTEL
jgi:hypothetical protein